MTRPLRYALVSVRELLASAGPFVVLACALLALAYYWLDPTPPKQVTLATGTAQSANDEFGKRYAQALAAYGIEVKLVESEGAAHNLELLTRGQVDLGFVQGGSGDPQMEAQQQLVSLGNLFVEPLWLFYRSPKALNGLADFKNMRMNIGTTGSGVPRLRSQLFELNRMKESELILTRLSQTLPP